MRIRSLILSSRFVGFYAYGGRSDDLTAYVLGSLVAWNLLLASFNLLPIAPLDGFKVALGVLPREAAAQFARLERSGPAILLGIIMLSFILPGPSILGTIIGPIVDALTTLVLGGQP